MQTKDSFVDNDDFDQEEAMEAAVHDKRKFLVNNFSNIILLPTTATAMMKTIKYFEDFFQIVMMMMINELA